MVTVKIVKRRMCDPSLLHYDPVFHIVWIQISYSVCLMAFFLFIGAVVIDSAVLRRRRVCIL